MISRSLTRQFVIISRHPHAGFQLQRLLLSLQRKNATVAPILHQIRYQSTEIPPRRPRNGTKYPNPPAEEAQSERPRQRVRFDMSNIRKAIKENPFQGGLAILIISFALVSFVIVIGFEMYIKLFVKHNYPENVARTIRKALFFTSIKPDPSRALKFYKEAIFQAQEAGLHPMSDEVLGLKLHLAYFFEEKSYCIENAIVVYESVYRDCVEWLGKEGDKHLADGNRTRVLERAVRTAVRLGELYGMPQIKRFEDSEEILSIATETVLKERHRRKEQGVILGDRDFLSDDEVGASMERLAEAYSRRKKPHLAAPLYLHAISLCPPNSCHSVILMNNMASAIAEQPTPPPSVPLPKDFPSPSQQAEVWARQALQLAANIPVGDRNEECITGCATAKANIAELIERDGRLAEALKFFEEAENEAKSVGFSEGMQVAGEGKRRVQEAIKIKSP